MIPEMQRGRAAGSAQAATGNLQQSHTLLMDLGHVAADKGLDQGGSHSLGGFPALPELVPTCAVREDHEEERGPGHGDTVPEVLELRLGWARPLLTILLPKGRRLSCKFAPIFIWLCPSLSYDKEPEHGVWTEKLKLLCGEISGGSSCWVKPQVCG